MNPNIWCNGKEPACQCRRHKSHGFNHWVRKIPWSTKWQPTPVFLPGKFHGQRSLAGYSPWGHKETQMTEWASKMWVNRHLKRAWKLSKLDENDKPLDSKSLSSRPQAQKIVNKTIMHIIIKLLKISDQDKILKADWGKKTHYAQRDESKNNGRFLFRNYVSEKTTEQDPLPMEEKSQPRIL